MATSEWPLTTKFDVAVSRSHSSLGEELFRAAEISSAKSESLCKFSARATMVERPSWQETQYNHKPWRTNKTATPPNPRRNQYESCIDGIDYNTFRNISIPKIIIGSPIFTFQRPNPARIERKRSGVSLTPRLNSPAGANGTPGRQPQALSECGRGPAV